MLVIQRSHVAASNLHEGIVRSCGGRWEVDESVEGTAPAGGVAVPAGSTACTAGAKGENTTATNTNATNARVAHNPHPFFSLLCMTLLEPHCDSLVDGAKIRVEPYLVFL